MKLAYLTTSFGTPSHTFIRREVRELRNQGIDVSLYGVRPDTNIAPDATDLDAETRFLYPIRAAEVMLYNLYYALTHPRRYWACLVDCLSAKNLLIRQRLKLCYHLLVSVSHARDMQKKHIEHIHAHFLNSSSSITMFCSRLTGIPYSVTVHSAGERDLPHVIAIAEKMKYSSQLLMISKFNIHYYNDLYPCEDKSEVVRCGMDIGDFIFRKTSSPRVNEPLKLLAVGRFVEKKGFRYLIEAAGIAKSKGQNFKVEILGSGPLEKDLHALRDALDLKDLVHFFGQATTAQVKEKMLAADVVVVPSVTSESGEMEGIPVVIMEAMASGVPVIASAHSGIPELVTDETGYIVPEKDAQALAATLMEYSFDEDRTRAARELIETQFNIETVVRQRVKIFLNNRLQKETA